MKENGIFKPYLMLRQLNLIKLCLLLSMFTLLSASLIAGNTEQQKQLKGVVKSTDNAPLPGVTVVVKGTTAGTITDGDGKFLLQGVPATAKTLLFSFVGMKSQEIVIGDKADFTIVLEDETIGDRKSVV